MRLTRHAYTGLLVAAILLSVVSFAGLRAQPRLARPPSTALLTMDGPGAIPGLPPDTVARDDPGTAGADGGRDSRARKFQATASLPAAPKQTTQVPAGERATITPSAASEPATASPTATPNAGPADPLEDSLVVSMWGNPTGLGVLGDITPDAAMAQLDNLKGTYSSVDGDRNVVPAFFLVYAVAQDEPTDNGLYLRYLDDHQVWPYLTLAHQNHGLLFLDLQMGLSDVRTQLERLRPYLLDPAVNIALDPEYAVRPGQEPGGLDAGHLDAEDLNTAQQYLEQLTEENGLPDKILVVHQFQDNVITNGDRVQHFDHVKLVVNMDAFGEPQEKVEKYEQFARRPYAEYGSFNLFLKLDKDLMPPDKVMALSPRPAIVIYQ